MKFKGIFAAIIAAFTLVSCGPTSNPTDPSVVPPSEEPVIEISDEDKAYPSSSTLEYDEYVAGKKNDIKYNTDKWYRNDLKIALPDPCIYEEDGVYYVYGTTDRTGARSFDCYTTTDFTNFTPHTNVWTPSSIGFANISCFAPEMFKIGDKYYLYFSAGCESKPNIPTGIFCAVADNPLGPFVEYNGPNIDGDTINQYEGPLWHDPKRPELSILDITILLEDNGDIYAYYSVYETGVMQYIVGVKMKDPFTPDWDTHKVVIRPGALNANDKFNIQLSWEAIKNFRVAEGPQITKTPGGRYMISYSVNHYPDIYYTVCYAMADEPLGDFVKPYEKNGSWTNILFGYAGVGVGTVAEQWAGFAGGTAHHFIFKSGNQFMIAYHALTARQAVEGHPGRAVGVDYLFFDENDNPYVHGPSWSIQPLPEAMSGYKNLSLNATFTTENIEYPERLNDNYIVEHYHLPQEQNKEANVKQGKSYIKITFDKEYAVGGLAIYNSAYYEYYLSDISFIKLGGEGNNITEGRFSSGYINDNKEFVFPCSSFAFDLPEDVVTKEIIIGIDAGFDARLNEIMILGKEVA